MSLVANQTGYIGFLQQVNTELMRGWFGVVLLLTIIVIVFMSFMATTNHPKKAAMASSFIGFLMCIFLVILELIPSWAIFIVLIIFAGIVAFYRQD